MKKVVYLFLTLVLSMSAFCGCNVSNENVEGNNEIWRPQKTVTIICGYGVGGSSDLFARVVAKNLSEYWGVDVIVSNIEGASGAIGTSQCYVAAPDGYTVVVSNGATLTQSALAETEWTYQDFTNIAKIIDEDEILCVKSSSDISDINDLVLLCNKNPGKISVGVAGVGGFTYLAAQKFIRDMNIDVKVIPYDSGAETISAVMGEYVDFCMQQPAEVCSGIESRKIKGISIMSNKRHENKIFSNIKTSGEQNIEFLTNQWRGISAPKNLPDNIKEGWINAIKNISESERFKCEINDTLIARMNVLYGDDMDKFMDEQYKWIYPLMKELSLVGE